MKASVLHVPVYIWNVEKWRIWQFSGEGNLSYYHLNIFYKVLLSFLSHPTVLKITFLNAGIKSCAAFIAWVYVFYGYSLGKLSFSAAYSFLKQFSGWSSKVGIQPRDKFICKFLSDFVAISLTSESPSKCICLTVSSQKCSALTAQPESRFQVIPTLGCWGHIVGLVNQFSFQTWKQVSGVRDCRELFETVSCAEIIRQHLPESAE